eukprot:gnl/TRDRNA2_/TRDRNA2_91840_c0_seq1.p1 gnl/TRDRNA2_/TRDRNA2_91840_c0~~gnl/TRDRNA2_/TRDRNA2_91840_c0_seq1.p1  ORF type:complete len:490 (+),score=55.78 gnl/TRDRNA2_/TRDRNA2_91840_c0_seq1:81-1550(+)
MDSGVDIMWREVRKVADDDPEWCSRLHRLLQRSFDAVYRVACGVTNPAPASFLRAWAVGVLEGLRKSNEDSIRLTGPLAVQLFHGLCESGCVQGGHALARGEVEDILRDVGFPFDTDAGTKAVQNVPGFASATGTSSCATLEGVTAPVQLRGASSLVPPAAVAATRAECGRAASLEPIPARCVAAPILKRSHSAAPRLKKTVTFDLWPTRLDVDLHRENGVESQALAKAAALAREHSLRKSCQMSPQSGVTAATVPTDAPRAAEVKWAPGAMWARQQRLATCLRQRWTLAEIRLCLKKVHDAWREEVRARRQMRRSRQLLAMRSARLRLYMQRQQLSWTACACFRAWYGEIDAQRMSCRKRYAPAVEVWLARVLAETRTNLLQWIWCAWAAQSRRSRRRISPDFLLRRVARLNNINMLRICFSTWSLPAATRLSRLRLAWLGDCLQKTRQRHQESMAVCCRWLAERDATERLHLAMRIWMTKPVYRSEM